MSLSPKDHRLWLLNVATQTFKTPLEASYFFRVALLYTFPGGKSQTRTFVYVG